MITKDFLLDLAVGAELEMEANALPVGTRQTSTWIAASVRKEAALRAARWLEEMGLNEREQVGPFGGKTLQRGDKVRIKAGTVIRTTHPKYDHSNPKIAKRSYSVTIHSVDGGTISSHWHPHQVSWAARDQEITWPGEGGYWCYASTSDVEVI